MTLVAGVDSSTQSRKVVIRDLASGDVVRSGRPSHPDGTEVHPDHWWTALLAAIDDAGGLDDVAAISVGGQQHGMVALDAEGRVEMETRVRPLDDASRLALQAAGFRPTPEGLVRSDSWRLAD